MELVKKFANRGKETRALQKATLVMKRFIIEPPVAKLWTFGTHP